MLNKIINNITAFSPKFGPSTREEEVQRALNQALINTGASVKGDAIGNLWTLLHSEDGLRIAIVAHADEIGVQIVSIDEPGIARFRKIGGLRASSLIGQKLKFVNSQREQIIGVVGSDPMQDNGTDNGLLLKTSDLWIDIGAESLADFERKLSVGDFGVFDVNDVEFLSQHRMCGKALDDRSGIAVALSVYEQAAVNGIKNISLVSTTQEELNLYGAKALPLDADVAIVIDVDFCSDTPSAIAESTPLHLGKGCGICLSADTSPVLIKLVKEIAEEKHIPLQFTVGRNISGGTDAAALRLKNDLASIVLSIPLRYMHTAHEVLDTRDLEYTASLAFELLKKLSCFNDKSELIPWK